MNQQLSYATKQLKPQSSEGGEEGRENSERSFWVLTFSCFDPSGTKRENNQQWDPQHPKLRFTTIHYTAKQEKPEPGGGGLWQT